MDCPECARLEVERDSCERAFASTVAIMNAAANSGDQKEYARLRDLAQEAGLETAHAEARLKQHHQTHAVAN